MSIYLKFVSISAMLVSLTVKGDEPVCSHTVAGVGTTSTVVTRATDILDFSAISDGKKVYVNWASGSHSYDYFTIEKARDGINFEPAAMIKGADNVGSPVDYMDIDYSPYAGISYYRLRETDHNGDVYYSETVAVNFGLLKNGAVIASGPRMPDVTELKEIESKTLLVVLKDNKGHDHVTKVQITDKDNKLYAADKSNLKHGTYMVVASSHNRLCGQTLILN